MLNIAYCHRCGGITDPEYICTQCDENVCEDCMVKMTIHNQIDYCLCETCHSGNEFERAEYHGRLEDEEKERQRIKKEKAHQRWLKYHSATEIEKRRLKRIELLKYRKEMADKRAETLANVFRDLFKHM